MASRRLFPTLVEMTTKEYVRDRMAVFFTVMFPLLFVVIFGIAGETAPPSFTIGVRDLQGDQASAALVAFLDDQPGIEIESLPAAGGTSLESLREEAQAMNLPGILLLPPGSIDGGDGPPITVVSSARGSAIVAATLRFAQAVLIAEQVEEPPPFRYELSPADDEALTDFGFTFPGLLAMALLQLGLFATAVPLITARQRGSLRHLAVTPLPPLRFLQAHVLTRFVIALFQVTVILGIAALLFDVRIAGSAALLLLIIVLGTVMFVSIGYTLAGIVPGGEAGVGIVLLVNFGFLAFGQVFLDFSESPVLSILTRAVPLSYLSDSLRQIVVEGRAQAPLFLNVAAMAGWTVVASALAVRTFRLDATPRGKARLGRGGEPDAL